MARQRHSRGRRSGGVLVEFAIVALVFYVLFAAIVDMGRASFMAITANDAARLLARELALAPLPATIGFEAALSSTVVQGEPSQNYYGIYDEGKLVIDLDSDLAPGQSLDEYFGSLPIVNRALRPLMIFDTVDTGTGERRLLRYPGAIFRLSNVGGDDIYRILIPVVSRVGNSEEVVDWLPVVQEVRVAAPGVVAPAESPFSALSPEGGIAAVRINVPFQASATASASLSSSDPSALFDADFGDAVLATSTGQSTEAAAKPPALLGIEDPELVTPSNSTESSGAYAGSYGLGQFQMLGTQVRPYRRILSAQAVFRREVFAAADGGF